MRFEQILTLDDGPSKTEALVAWLQSLYDEETSAPVLVGGAAVELLTGGAYSTGDLDFVGTVPDEVAAKLTAAGFEKRGRHWIHDKRQVLLEFPGSELGPDEEVVALEIGGGTIRVLAPEGILVDRLAAWQFWGSTTDAVNSFLILRAASDRIDKARLELMVESRGLSAAWKRLAAFHGRFTTTDPTAEELTAWAESLEF